MVKPLLKQIYGSIGTICLYFSNGYILGLQSVVVPSLRDTTLHLTQEQESWIPSVLVLMVFPSQCISGLATHKFGRKKVLICTILPNLLACIALYNAYSFAMFIIAFMTAGLVGGGIAVGPLLVAESCSPKYRGVLMNVKTAALSIGLAVSHLFSSYYDWRTLALFGTLPTLLGLVTIITSPESPAWLASEGRFKECKEAFSWLRGDEDVGELNQLIKCQEKKITMKRIRNDKQKNNIVSFFKFLLDKIFLKSVYITIACILIIEVSGKQIFIAYAFDMINSIVNDKANSYYYALGLDIADVIAVIISCITVGKLKRRTILFGSGVPAMILLLIICLVSFLFTGHYIPSQYSWITLLLLSIYFVIINVGITPTLYTVLGEVVPLTHRGVGLVLSSFVYVTFMFLITKISPSIVRAWGIHGTFLLNALIASLALFYLYFYLVETDNKTLQDIENELNNEPTNHENECDSSVNDKMLNINLSA